MTPLPNFFILGAAKSGTTALYYLLEKQASVHLSTPKEPNFFEFEYERGPEFYWNTYFADGWSGQPLVGEARVVNLCLPYVPERIRAMVPEAKLIAILRHPVERAFSHWWMLVCEGREKRTFDEAIRNNLDCIASGVTSESNEAEQIWCSRLSRERNEIGMRTCSLFLYLESGYYDHQLERYLQYFPRSQLCVLFHHELSIEPVRTARRLFEFLGLDPAEITRPPKRENVGLTSFSQSMSTVSRRLRLERILPRGLLAFARTWLSKFGDQPGISSEMRHTLLEHYEPHNRRLEALLDCDLSDWIH